MVIFESAKFDPTLKSMPPASMTIIIAMTTRPISPSCRVCVATLPVL